jgi:hypothetical protein
MLWMEWNCVERTTCEQLRPDMADHKYTRLAKQNCDVLRYVGCDDFRCR